MEQLRTVAMAWLLTVALAGCGHPVERSLSAKVGGSVAYGAEATLLVPPESLPGDARLGIARLAAESIPTGDESGFRHFGQAYRLTPAGTAFDLSKPATLKLRIDTAALADRGLGIASLVVHYYDEQAGRFVAVPTTVDEAAGTATALIEHFTIYAPLAQALVAGHQPPICALQGSVPLQPRAGAPLLVRATVRDPNPGGAVSGVQLIARVAGQRGTLTLTLNRDLSTGSVDTYTTTIPSSMTASPNVFGYTVVAIDSLGRQTLCDSGDLTPAHSYRGSLTLAPAAQSMAAGFSRTFALTAKDEAGTSFNLAPDSASAGDLGVLDPPIAAGLTLHARKEGVGTLSATVGTDVASAAITVFNGQLAKLTILDSRGQPIAGTLAVKEGGHTAFDVRGEDEFGNFVFVAPTWSVLEGLSLRIDAGGVLNTLDAFRSGRIQAQVGLQSSIQWIDVLPRNWTQVASLVSASRDPPAALSIAVAGSTPLVAFEADGSLYVANGSSGIAEGPLTSPGASVFEAVLASAGSTVYLAYRETSASPAGQILVKHRLAGSAGVWVQDGGPVGVHPQSTLQLFALALDGSTPRVAWQESDLVGLHLYAAHLDAAAGTWIQDGGDLADGPAMAVPGASLAIGSDGVTRIAFTQNFFAFSGVEVKHWDGHAWITDGGGLLTSNANSGLGPKLVVIGATPYVLWAEADTLGKSFLNVKHFDGTAWVSDGSANGASSTVKAFELATDGFTPYVYWQNGTLDPGFVAHQAAGGAWIGNFPPPSTTTLAAGLFTIGQGVPYFAFEGGLYGGIGIQAFE